MDTNISKKSINDLINAYNAKLHTILDDYNTSTSKTRENLLVFTENSKQNIENSWQYCQNIIMEINNEIAALPSLLRENINKIQKKQEKRLDDNTSIIDKYNEQCKEEIDRINTEYDLIVSMKNDELDNLHYLNEKDKKTKNDSLDKEEGKQTKELNSTIEDIIFDIEDQKAKLERDIENLKQEFLDTTTNSNEKMREIRNKYISIERDFRNKSLVDIGNYNKQIEENNEKFFIVQRRIINEFKHNLILCSEEYDKLFSEYHNNPLKLLEEQTQNKILRYTYEIDKNAQIKIEKEKLNSKIQNVKIFKTDYDDSLNFEINKANFQSLTEIAEYEKKSALADANKSNHIDSNTLECNAKIKQMQLRLEDRRKELNFFKKRFALLRKYNNDVASINSQLYDTSITLDLDANQLEREYKISLSKIATHKKKNSITYINSVSDLEYEKEVILAKLENELSQIDYEIKKIHHNYDHVIFKMRADYNVEKTRIEHILRLFEAKYNKETSTLRNDTNLISDICQRYKISSSKYSSSLLEDVKAGKIKTSEAIDSLRQMITSVLDLLVNLSREYFGNKTLRSTPNIDKMMDEYLQTTKEKRISLIASSKENEQKIELIEKDIFSNESDIIYLESTRKSLLEKGKRDISKMSDHYSKVEYKKLLDEELSEITSQIDDKNFKIHIMKLRLKSHTKDYTSFQNEIARIDESTKLFSKKESQKLFDLKLENIYFDNYDELQKIIYSFFDGVNTMMLSYNEKKKKLSIFYKLSVAVLTNINDVDSKIRSFSNTIMNTYNEQMQKIITVCNLNLLKEKKNLARNILSINREREIAIEEINAKSLLAKKVSHEAGIKCNTNILALKGNDDDAKQKIEQELVVLKRQFTINTGALKENVRRMKEYYAQTLHKLEKKREIDFSILNKQRLRVKNNYEENLARLQNEYSIDNEKLLEVFKTRFINVEKMHVQKLKSLTSKVKLLENHRLSKIKTKTKMITETNMTLYEHTKTIESDKQIELSTMKKDCFKKLKHEKKKLTSQV